MWLVFLPIHWTNFTHISDVCVKRCLWVEPCARMMQRRLELTWTPNLYGFLPCKSLEVTYGSVKIIFETKINFFAFSKPKKHHFVCKTTKNEQQLLRQSYLRPSHHQLLRQVPKSERLPSGFRALPKTSFKTTFCSFSHVSEHFWTKWVTNSFSSANFALISEKWLWPLEYPFKKPANEKLRELRRKGCLGYWYLFNPSDDQAIYCNKLTQGGGIIRTPPPPHRFSKRLQIKDQALACKQLWISSLPSITKIKF